MASLTDLFNPTFLMFLGILVLVVALLVVYFESKFREQNHKISSMLSLVSSLAEELNGTKMVIQHLSMRGGVQPQNFQQEQTFSNFNDLEENVAQQNTNNIKLIQVSDDENSDSESETSDNSSESNDSIEILDDDNENIVKENDDESVNSDNSVIEIGEHNDIKILKLNITKQNDDESVNSEEEQNLDFDDLDDLENLSESSESLSINDETQLEEITEVNDTKDDNIKSMDLKSINITLEETKHESLDYKKMALPKLRSVVTEKGLTSDASKLKKNELLKLLGIE
jgi:hypothetical protein